MRGYGKGKYSLLIVRMMPQTVTARKPKMEKKPKRSRQKTKRDVVYNT